MRPWPLLALAIILASTDGMHNFLHHWLKFANWPFSSLKTEDNLKVVQEIPAEKILLETDAPWCEIRASHCGSKHVKTSFDGYQVVKKPDKWVQGCVVKARNEPMFIQ